MTPERLQLIIDACLSHRRDRDVSAHYRDIARFLHIEPHTLRRWLTGERPIPRPVEIIFEIFYAEPTINARMVEALIAQRDK